MTKDSIKSKPKHGGARIKQRPNDARGGARKRPADAKKPGPKPNLVAAVQSARTSFRSHIWTDAQKEAYRTELGAALQEVAEALPPDAVWDGRDIL